MQEQEPIVKEIIQKLELFSIKNIISIDNDWDGNKEHIDLYGSFDEYIRKNAIELNEDELLEVSNEGIATIKDLLNYNGEELYKLRENICKLIKNDVKIEPSLISLSKLLEEIQSLYKVNVEKYSNSNIQFDKYNENCLFILDRNMGNDKHDIIIDTIIDINKNSEDRKDIIIIYSNECGNDYINNKTKLRYLEEKGLNGHTKLQLLYQMWGIKKTGIEEELFEGFNYELSKSIYGFSLYSILNTKKNSIEKTFNELMFIETSDLSNLINDCFIEGENIVRSLDNLLESIKNKNDLDNLKSRDYLKAIECLGTFEKEKVNELETKISSKNAYENFRKKQTKDKLELSKKNSAHFNIMDYSINTLYTDISTGDLFKFKMFNSDEWNYGILISQSCECVIRILDYNNISNRRNKDMKLLLLSGKALNDEVINTEAKEFKKISSKVWPIEIDNEKYIFCSLQKTLDIPDYILDLCSLNDSGEAKLGFDLNKALLYKSFHSASYFSKFKENYIESIMLQDINEISNKYGEILNTICLKTKEEIACEKDCTVYENISKLNDLGNILKEDFISLKYGFKYENDCFNLKRIGRLEDKRTLLFIQDYVYSLSKVGTESVKSLKEHI